MIIMMIIYSILRETEIVKEERGKKGRERGGTVIIG